MLYTANEHFVTLYSVILALATNVGSQRTDSVTLFVYEYMGVVTSV